MTRIKTLTAELKPFFTKREIEELDERTNQFLAPLKRVIAVSDTCTTDDSGATIGLIRAVTYEE